MVKVPTATAKGKAVNLTDFSEPKHEDKRTMGRASKMANSQTISRAEQGIKAVLNWVAESSADQAEQERDFIDDAWGYVLGVVGTTDLGALPAPTKLKEFKAWFDLFNLNSRQQPLFSIIAGLKHEEDTLPIAKTEKEEIAQKKLTATRIEFTTLKNSCIPSNFYKKFGWLDTDTIFSFLFCLRRGDMGTVNNELKDILKDHFLGLAFIRKANQWFENWKEFWTPILSR